MAGWWRAPQRHRQLGAHVVGPPALEEVEDPSYRPRLPPGYVLAVSSCLNPRSTCNSSCCSDSSSSSCSKRSSSCSRVNALFQELAAAAARCFGVQCSSLLDASGGSLVLLCASCGPRGGSRVAQNKDLAPAPSSL